MRKGYLIIQLLVIIAVLVIVSLPLARLSTATLRDIPMSYRMIASNTSILNALEQIRKDVNAARGFPESFDDYTANDETLLIELANDTICYQLKNDELLRRKLANTKTGGDEETESWSIRHGKIQWRLQRKDDKDYAVEIRTCIEQKIEGHLEKKMANSHLYFIGAYQEVVD